MIVSERRSPEHPRRSFGRSTLVLAVVVPVLLLTACEQHPAGHTPWNGQLLNGVYALFPTGTTAESCPGVADSPPPPVGETFTVHRDTATAVGQDTPALAGSAARRANVFTIRTSGRYTDGPAVALNLHGSVWSATDLTGTGEFAGDLATAAGTFDCKFSFVARLTSAHPPCIESAVKSALSAQAGPSAIVYEFECIDHWATGAWVRSADDPSDTFLLHSQGNRWKKVDARRPCATGEIPSPIFHIACESD